MAASFTDPEMMEIFEGFLIETQELLDTLTSDLMEIEQNPDDDELINKIFRSFHTIKGTSSFMGVDKISTITHNAEDILNKVRRHEMSINQDIIDVMLEVQDWIMVMLDQLKAGEDIDVDYSETLEKLNILKTGASLSNDPPVTPRVEIPDTNQNVPTEEKVSALDMVLTNPEITSHPGDFTPDEYELLDKAFAEMNQKFASEVISTESNIAKDNLSIKETSQTELEQESEKKSEEYNVTEDVEVQKTESGELHEKGVAKTDDKTKPHPDKPKDKATTQAVTTETIRIDVGRVESLMDLSGELVLSRNRLMQIGENIDSRVTDKELIRELIDSTAQLDFITSEIQNAVMKMRMVPIGKLFQKAPRIVRDLSKEFGKKIKLILKGEETEIDRGIIEELNDPLVHMIRNSCDHGVETPQERLRKGKPEEGTLILDASQEGNNIVIKIIDDGAGMDPQKLINKAIEKGIIKPEEAMSFSKREAFQLIFAPGFSTAKVVTSVSGRGVGMDVVRTNIQALKGMVDIESEIDKGTTFIIKLPLTLAIIQGLLVKIQNETYAIPLSSVLEVVSTSNCEISTVNKKEVIRIRKDVFPLIRLDYALKHPEPIETLEGRNVVIVGVGVEKYGLVCDELLGQQEIVIKSLGEYLGNIKGIAGSTILGDGRVIMIIDIGDLISELSENRHRFMMMSS